MGAAAVGFHKQKNAIRNLDRMRWIQHQFVNTPSKS